MRIVADENIPLLDEFFAGLGEVRRLPGRRISATDVGDADVLLVRSVTRVDARLVTGSRLRFVGSATIGTDHVDVAALAAQGIAFAAAPGCNARAVAEYLATVLLLGEASSGIPLAGSRLGIVGYGSVGRQVASMATALGLAVGVADPFLPAAAFPAGVSAMNLAEITRWADVMTFHVPLTAGGPHATRHLVDAQLLTGFRGRLLVNTARGDVVDGSALSVWLDGCGARRAVLDVWEGEPVVPGALAARTWLATPHVAGYSQDGKWRGTAQVHAALCKTFGLAPAPGLAEVLVGLGDVPETVAWPGSLAGLLAACCPVPEDSARLKAGLSGDAAADGEYFDRLRRDYPARREFTHYRVEGVPEGLGDVVALLGFGVLPVLNAPGSAGR